MITFLGFLILLGPPVWTDLKSREIPVIFCLSFSILAVICNLVFSWVPIWEEIGGLIFGGLFFLASWISKGAIGLGDGWLILAGSLWCGVIGGIEITFLALVAAGLGGAIYVTAAKKGWKTKLPFAPFYGAAAIVYSAIKWVSEVAGQ